MPRTASITMIASTCLALASPLASAQTIIQGPVYNPATGSRYYVIQGSNWTQMRDFARSRGGDLATINDAAENTWIRANLTANNTRKLFIGLNDADVEGSLRWSDGSTSAYRNWEPGGPGNNATDDYALLNGPTGLWDLYQATFSPTAVMEVSGTLKVPQEFATIESAILFADDLNAGIIIDVAPGTYTLPSKLTVFNDGAMRGTAPGVIVRSATGQPFLDSFGSWRLENIHFIDRASTTYWFRGVSLFRNCTFTSIFERASAPIFRAASTLIAERCTFRSVSALTLGAAGSIGDFRFVNCLIDDVPVLGTGPSEALSLVNCTLHRVGDGTQVVLPGWTASVTNSVFSNVSGQVNRNGVVINYSIIPFEIPGTTGNIMGAPVYVNAAAGDFRLRPGTRGVDQASINALFAASPTAPADASGAMRFVDDPTATDGPAAGVPWALDMGAFETQSAPCPADFNNDGAADFFDYLDFVAAFDIGC